ncbi:MAG: hypothetical protein CVV10_05960 [Gammaproteobacteria bacterium HGW-Gammaproteobacteria-14]|nr:MAG: hypothetical protein CVV10_05960 [Gammaproteobacteria bacterium HGW-Gammaproteobacteria-14]
MRLSLLLLAVVTTPVAAHYIPVESTPVTVDASMVMTWRSASLIDDYDFWQIPGTQMGGHAWPAQKGFSLDEMNLNLGYRIDENFFSVIKLGSHAGGHEDHGGIELEHAYLGWVCCDDTGPWVAELGKMSARFSPGVAMHAADRWFSEAPLAVDVFFGRHFHDQGIRLWWHETAGVSAGAELWRGDAFPATHSENGGAWDVFARYAWQGGRLSLEFGGWFYSASADARADHRYGGGHQHVPVAPPGQTAALFPDVRYTGDTYIVGLHGKLGYRLHRDWLVTVETEWMRAEMDGAVHDGINRQAQLDATQQAGWVQSALNWRRQSVAVRWEQLSTDNALVGAAAPQLGVQSGLDNPQGHTPKRMTAAWSWQWRDGVTVRAEAIRDESLLTTEQRWTLGVVWKQRLLPQGASMHHGH